MAAARGPRARPGVLDIAPYVPGTSALPGAHPVIKLSSNETPFGPSPRAHRGLSRRGAKSVALPRRLGAAPCARRSPQLYGLDPARIVCGAGSDELLNLLAGAYLGPGDEAIYSAHGFLVYKIAILAARRHAGGRAGDRSHRRCRRHPRRVSAAHAPRVHRQSQQSDRHLSAVRRGEAPARRSAARRAARARRGLCRICAAERLRGRHRAGRHHRQHGDDAHLLQDLRPRDLRLGWAYCPTDVADALNRIRGSVQRVRRRPSPPASPRSPTSAWVQRGAEHNELWRGRMAEALSELGLGVTPSVGEFPPAAFSQTATASRRPTPTSSCMSGASSCGGSRNTACPTALRMTIGTEEENRAVIDALAAFMGGNGAA